MWKKHGMALLGIILTLAVLLTGVKLPEYVAAAGNDKSCEKCGCKYLSAGQ